MAIKPIEVGGATEEKIIQFLRDRGYYAYLTPMRFNGQPVDIIAAKRTETDEAIIYLIDSKHVESGVSFPFSDIRPNQITTFIYAKDYAKLKNLGFAILFERTGLIYWFPYETFLEVEKTGRKSVNLNELKLLEEVIK